MTSRVMGNSGEENTMRFQPKSRAEVLATKRAITESRLAYAREIGDRKLIAQNEAQLARIAQWEQGA